MVFSCLAMGEYLMVNILLGVHAATAVDDLSRHIRRKVAGEEQCYVGHILGRTAATQRDTGVPLLFHFFGQYGGHVGDDEAGGDGVATDVAHAHFLGSRFGETNDAGL